jgi:hypothetical protein
MPPQPVPNPHVTPLPSWVSRPPTSQRAPNFLETLIILGRWWRGVQPSWKDRVREAKLVDALAEGMAEEEGMRERLVSLGGKEGRDGRPSSRRPCPKYL